jgi:hypothetical protein
VKADLEMVKLGAMATVVETENPHLKLKQTKAEKNADNRRKNNEQKQAK